MRPLSAVVLTTKMQPNPVADNQKYSQELIDPREFISTSAERLSSLS